jgi:signal transduction histidine kinase
MLDRWLPGRAASMVRVGIKLLGSDNFDQRDAIGLPMSGPEGESGHALTSTINAPQAAIADAAMLISYLERREESRVSALARELHDDFGGLLVGAMMDLAWVGQREDMPPELKAKLQRAQQTLAQAIDRKRQLIEELRPTLLLNVGLYAALRWQMKLIGERTGTHFEIDFPVGESQFSTAGAIALYRIAVAMLRTLECYDDLHVSVEIDDTFSLQVRGLGEQLKGERRIERNDCELSLAARRTQELAGELRHEAFDGDSETLSARIPMLSLQD